MRIRTMPPYLISTTSSQREGERERESVRGRASKDVLLYIGCLPRSLPPSLLCVCLSDAESPLRMPSASNASLRQAAAQPVGQSVSRPLLGVAASHYSDSHTSNRYHTQQEGSTLRQCGDADAEDMARGKRSYFIHHIESAPTP